MAMISIKSFPPFGAKPLHFARFSAIIIPRLAGRKQPNMGDLKKIAISQK
jgi:hypothetical protein